MDRVEKELIEQMKKEGYVFEMATVGYFQEIKENKPKGDRLKVFTTSDKGFPQVHVHIGDDSTMGAELNICIKLDKPEYFIHDKSSGKFTKSQLEAFIKFMKTPYHGPLQYNGAKIPTMWDYTIVQWNLENPEHEIPIEEKDGFVITPPMPDYTKLR